jgi:hypothetical protein
VTIVLQGPSPDFIVGRIFENAMGDAFDSIVKYDKGMPLEASNWINNGEIRKSKAQTSYLKGNCALLK